MPSNVRFLDQVTLGPGTVGGFINQSGSNYYVLGNFGINTINPQAALDVVGSAIISGNLNVTSVTGSSFTGSFTGDGTGLTGVIAEWDGTLNGNAQITGSLIVTNGITGSLFGTSSWAQNVLSSSYSVSSSFAATTLQAQTASFVATASWAQSASQAVTASFIATASWANNAVTASCIVGIIGNAGVLDSTS
jgi:hypothetical protein